MYKWQCSVSKIWCIGPCSQGATSGRLPLQICCFKAATGKAFTTVFAGCGLTFTSLPNIILLPPFVAFFLRVLIMQRPGSVNLPFFFTSLLPISASASNTFESSPFFNPAASANSVARAPLDINFALFIAFMVALAFIAFIGAIAGESGARARGILSQTRSSFGQWIPMRPVNYLAGQLTPTKLRRKKKDLVKLINWSSAEGQNEVSQSLESL